ncbi:MAG: DegT/DnrJ/EryC1/StrS family aminotransferase [Gammaproteobacteria bacterium]|nr:DegT/DnrJ/EryC1/StrS family aminotransferase [Gammaproteobacteria bacterium]MDH5652831.1 DegT/DnrJ/EryC1/StrS family aminotransferase [Gammaproteobacteria bacterium]
MIPMVDLKRQYHKLKNEIDQGILQALESTQFILGPNVSDFEKEAADYLGAKHAISCASGTDALHLALAAAGIGPGDEVITTTFTFIATAEAICYVGATPVFVDIDPKTYNIDIDAMEAAVTDKTKALIPVHLFGQPVDMTRVMAIAEKHNLLVIEDCAQSFGADVNGKMTGTISLAGCHSFFPSKNLGCYGDGGMVTTNDDAVAEQIKVLRNHGSFKRYHHNIIGYNSRLDELQAVILRVKLKHIAEFNTERRRAAHHYSSLLQGVVEPPVEDGIGTHVYHQYVALSDKRDAIMQKLSENNIANAVYYPIPLHKQPVFAEQCKTLRLPVSEQVAQRCFALPIHPELTNQQIEEIVAVIKSAV